MEITPQQIAADREVIAKLNSNDAIAPYTRWPAALDALEEAQKRIALLENALKDISVATPRWDTNTDSYEESWHAFSRRLKQRAHIAILENGEQSALDKLHADLAAANERIAELNSSIGFDAAELNETHANLDQANERLRLLNNSFAKICLMHNSLIDQSVEANEKIALLEGRIDRRNQEVTHLTDQGILTDAKLVLTNERLRECRNVIQGWAREKQHGKTYGLLLHAENKLLALAATEPEKP